MYEKAQGVGQDYAEAARWYRKAADQGMHIAQLSLGRLYASGRGVTRDPSEAARWYRKAADLGLASAQYELSLAYSSGTGVAPDPVAAYEWMDLAVFRAHGSIREKYSAARNALGARMTPEQLAEAKRRAGEWKAKWPL
jgi:TPR repeat protein